MKWLFFLGPKLNTSEPEVKRMLLALWVVRRGLPYCCRVGTASPYCGGLMECHPGVQASVIGVSCSSLSG